MEQFDKKKNFLNFHLTCQICVDLVLELFKPNQRKKDYLLLSQDFQQMVQDLKMEQFDMKMNFLNIHLTCEIYVDLNCLMYLQRLTLVVDLSYLKER